MRIKIERSLDENHDFAQCVIPGITLNISNLQLSNQYGDSTELTPKELQVFSQLQKSFSHPIPRSQLELLIWKGTHVSKKTLDVHLHHLRKKLSKIGLEVAFVGSDSYQVILKNPTK